MSHGFPTRNQSGQKIDRGPWFQTFTGRQFHLFDPTIDEIDILDIAHALSRVCRFGGQCTRHYSVAEHSIGVSYVVPPEDALEGLLHDAAEAYIGDIVHPLKAGIRSIIKPIEGKIEETIALVFSTRYPYPSTIKAADLAMLMTERAALMPKPQGYEWDVDEADIAPAKWGGRYKGDSWHESRNAGDDYFVPQGYANGLPSIDQIEQRFLDRFYRLMTERRIAEQRRDLRELHREPSIADMTDGRLR